MILLLPAAGNATRLPALAGRSKACMPIRPGRAAADALLRAGEMAAAREAIWLTREGTSDIRDYYGAAFGALPLRYHPLSPTSSTLETVRLAIADQSLQLDNAILALGFPDMQFRELDALQVMHTTLATSDADLVLGCFKTDRPEKVDTVSVDRSGRVLSIQIKSARPGSDYAWILAAWRPRFTNFLNRRPWPEARHSRENEHYLGHEIQAAIAAGFAVTAVRFDSPLLDIGTPEDLGRAPAFWADERATGKRSK